MKMGTVNERSVASALRSRSEMEELFDWNGCAKGEEVFGLISSWNCGAAVGCYERQE